MEKDNIYVYQLLELILVIRRLYNLESFQLNWIHFFISVGNKLQFNPSSSNKPIKA